MKISKSHPKSNGPPSTPALEAWRARLASGRVVVYDGLQSAACWEATALDAHRAGQVDYAQECLARAAEIIDTDGAALLELAARKTPVGPAPLSAAPLASAAWPTAKRGAWA